MRLNRLRKSGWQGGFRFEGVEISMEFTNDDGNVLEAFKCSKPDSSNNVPNLVYWALKPRRNK